MNESEIDIDQSIVEITDSTFDCTNDEDIDDQLKVDDQLNVDKLSISLFNDEGGNIGNLTNDVPTVSSNDSSSCILSESTVINASVSLSNDSIELMNVEVPSEELAPPEFESVDVITNKVDNQTSLDCNENIECEQVDNLESFIESDRNENNYFKSSCIELARRLFKSGPTAQHYTKGCLWSPDGTCLLLPVHMDGMHIVELPAGLYDKKKVSTKRPVSELVSAVHVPEGGTVYDCAWYPRMHSSYPETCCWVASRQHEPIHMWDAYTGELRCTYRGYDDVDEIETAISTVFSNDGQRVFGGYRRTIRIFDTSIPGRDCESIKVKQAISCFAQRSDSDDMITTGSWNGNIQHFDTRAAHLGSLFTLTGHTGGITWLKYSLLGIDWNLFSGARKDNRIFQWDMRNYQKPVREFHRCVATNQRIYFDITSTSQWMASGSTNGILHVWDLEGNTPDIELPLHNDCCNGVNYHPVQPILATSSGQYHFINSEKAEDPPSTEEVEKIVKYENAIVFLWVGDTDQE